MLQALVEATSHLSSSSRFRTIIFLFLAIVIPIGQDRLLALLRAHCDKPAQLQSKIQADIWDALCQSFDCPKCNQIYSIADPNCKDMLSHSGLFTYQSTRLTSLPLFLRCLWQSCESPEGSFKKSLWLLLSASDQVLKCYASAICKGQNNASEGIPSVISQSGRSLRSRH